MPAVVRGGRRQGSAQAPGRGAAPRGGGRSRGANPNASAIPAKMAAIGRVDISSRTAVIALGAGALLLVGVLATGARAERIGASVSHGIDSLTSGMGLTLKRVHITGASAEAEPAIRQALGLQSGQPITSLKLDAIRDRVQGVGWVKSARVVRLLPDTLIVEVKEHDRLAVWQEAGQIKVIDARGQVIAGADARRYPTLPLVVGKGADTAAGEPSSNNDTPSTIPFMTISILGTVRRRASSGAKTVPPIMREKREDRNRQPAKAAPSTACALAVQYTTLRMKRSRPGPSLR